MPASRPTTQNNKTTLTLNVYTCGHKQCNDFFMAGFTSLQWRCASRYYLRYHWLNHYCILVNSCKNPTNQICAELLKYDCLSGCCINDSYLSPRHCQFAIKNEWIFLVFLLVTWLKGLKRTIWYHESSSPWIDGWWLNVIIKYLNTRQGYFAPWLNTCAYIEENRQWREIINK